MMAVPTDSDTSEPLHLFMLRPRSGDMVTRSTADPPTRNTVSDSSIWFFLAAFGVFVTGLIWNVYVLVGIPRLKRMALDQEATSAMHDIEMARTSAVRMPEPIVFQRHVVRSIMPGTFAEEDASSSKGVVKRKRKGAGAGSWLKVAFREGDRLSKH